MDMLLGLDLEMYLYLSLLMMQQALLPSPLPSFLLVTSTV